MKLFKKIWKRVCLFLLGRTSSLNIFQVFNNEEDKLVWFWKRNGFPLLLDIEFQLLNSQGIFCQVFYFIIKLNVLNGWQVWTKGRPIQYQCSFTTELWCCNTLFLCKKNVYVKSYVTTANLPKKHSNTLRINTSCVIGLSLSRSLFLSGYTKVPFSFNRRSI